MDARHMTAVVHVGALSLACAVAAALTARALWRWWRAQSRRALDAQRKVLLGPAFGMAGPVKPGEKRQPPAQPDCFPPLGVRPPAEAGDSESSMV